MNSVNLTLKARFKRGEEIPVDEMYEMVEHHRQEMRPVDITEKLEHVVFNPQLGGAADGFRGMRLYLDDEGTKHGDFEILDHAFSQLCSRVGPAPYFKANVEAMPAGLQFQVVNHFIQEAAKKDDLNDRMRLFRVVRPTTIDRAFVRGILTHQYAPIDDADILHDLREVPDVEGALVREIDVDETFSHFKLIFPKTEVEVKKDDTVCRTLVIRNSEVGSARVQIFGGIERLICTNGMTSTQMTGGLNFVHRGDRHSKLRLLTYGIRDALGKTDRLVQSFRASLTAMIEDPIKSFERNQERFKWSDALTEKIRNRFVVEGGQLDAPSPVFPFVNAMTYVARDFSGENRFNLEKSAGDFLAVHVGRV